jgi:hypothetical protein
VPSNKDPSTLKVSGTIKTELLVGVPMAKLGLTGSLAQANNKAQKPITGI